MEQVRLGTNGGPKRADATPLLKWAGGKRWLVPRLEQMWSGHSDKRLVEPFVGGMAVSLGLNPAQALLNDFNPHLINFYRQVKLGIQLNIPMSADSDTFYKNRTEFNRLIQEGKGQGKRAAMLFYYLNRNCFNGLCRFNLKGEFNTPHGKYANPQIHSDLRFFSKFINNWEFTHGDFEYVQTKPGDFIYADPPYDDSFTSYSSGGFDWEDQSRLAKWLAKHDGPVVVSNHATERVISLYSELGFNTDIQIPAPRMIHCQGDRTPAMEMVATLNL